MEDYADKLDENGINYLERIRANSQNMGQLIDDLLTLSRIARTNLQFGIVSLSALAQQALEVLQESDTKKQVRVTIQSDMIVEGDKQLLRLVVSNLLENAWKYTAKSDHAQIDIGATRDGNQLTCFIRDNGVGFDMRYKDKLFVPFQRLHRSIEFEGTGIGLATVERVIHRHGGHVWAEGVPGSGATFFYRLPIRGE